MPAAGVRAPASKLTTERENPPVTGSPLVRAAVNLMVRFTPASAETFRMFGSEAEALAWLDARAED